MPTKKGNSPKNNDEYFTLPLGAKDLLDQLCELQEIGGSRAETIRFLVETQLQVYVDKGTIKRRPLPKPSDKTDLSN
jgi:hypothetical protein